MKNKNRIKPFSASDLYLVASNEKHVHDLFTSYLATLRRTVDNLAERQARANAAWFDDESPEAAEEHKRYHAKASVQFPERVRVSTLKQLISRHIEITAENKRSERASKAKSKREKQVFVFEVTDTYGGEANYCWMREHRIEAFTLHGALCILSRIEGLNFRVIGGGRYDAQNAAICAFLIEDI